MTTGIKTPVHVSVLLCFLALIGIFHFYTGWIAQGPSDLFAGLIKEGEGLTHLFAANGSRQLAISVLLILGASTRNIQIVLCGLMIRMICESFDIVLYGLILKQPAAALFATALLLWEILACLHIYKLMKKAN